MAVALGVGVAGEAVGLVVVELRGERALAHEAYSAALEEAGDQAARPLLKLKVADTADANEA